MSSPDKLEELFSVAVDLDAAERGPWLDQHCAGDAELRRAVEGLLRANETPLLDRAAFEMEARQMAGAPVIPWPRLGPYRILSRLGAGGMGEVYLAERDDDGLSKRVAIKMVPWALTGDEALRRFRQERQILARLEHPNIARMMDAGRSPDGLPYLVMEFVDGIRLDLYAADFPMERKLKLFRTICAAVSCAHANMIVHRDLKPGNILVTAEGVPKLLDFGIAKLLDERAAAKGNDATSTRVMTAGYASPEQIAGMAITPASDIYSLGVILCELLTGRKPDRNGIILQVNSDLDNIVLKALRAEPERRYASVAEFSDDVERYLSGYPVKARPDTFSYRARKLVRRRRVETAVALAAAIVVLGCLAALRWYSAPKPPHVGQAAVVAHRAEVDTRFATDGQRLFFVLRNGFRWTLAQTPLDGGPVSTIQTPFPVPTIFDISPNGTSLLIGQDANLSEQELWTMQTSGGSPRRIGALMVHDAAWSPDGRRILYTKGAMLYLAGADGTGSRLLAQIPGDYIQWPRFSPNRKTIRVSSYLRKQNTSSIWELKADGSGVHQWLPEWKPNRYCCGSWVDNGRYYVFQAKVNAAATDNIWAIPEEAGLWRRPVTEPFALTAGSHRMLLPIGAPDGRRIIAADASATGELTRYDAKSGAAVPYLGGISAEWPAFSRDGKQAAWVAFPSRQLWRGNVDGSDATRLSESSFRAMFTQWFPDGKRILTTSERAGRPAMAYVVDATAGEAKALISGDGPVWGPTLSPDGRYAALHRPVSTDSQSPLAIFIYDLQEKKLSELPGSRAKLEPSWSPDGRYLAAFWKPGEKPNAPADGSLQDIALWDFQTRSWTPLLHSDVIDLWVWSKDSHSAWFGCSSDGLNAICRVSVPGGKVEKVLDTWRFHRADTSHSNFAGLTPEGDPLFMQVTHDFDLYSLEVELPK